MTELLNDFLTGSVAWGVLLTLAAFGLGVLINKAQSFIHGNCLNIVFL